MPTLIKSNSKLLSARYRQRARKYPEAVAEALVMLSYEAQELFQKTTATWNQKPQFVPIRERGGVSVVTDDPVYRWIDAGTRPYKITARNAPNLVFRVGGRSKTRPNFIGSTAGRVGNKWRRKKSVNHPGITARNFSSIIFDRIQKKTAATVKNRIDVYEAGIE